MRKSPLAASVKVRYSFSGGSGGTNSWKLPETGIARGKRIGIDGVGKGGGVLILDVETLGAGPEHGHGVVAVLIPVAADDAVATDAVPELAVGDTRRVAHPQIDETGRFAVQTDLVDAVLVEVAHEGLVTGDAKEVVDVETRVEIVGEPHLAADGS